MTQLCAVQCMRSTTLATFGTLSCYTSVSISETN